jgi:hypothetical protein
MTAREEGGWNNSRHDCHFGAPRGEIFIRLSGIRNAERFLHRASQNYGMTTKGMTMKGRIQIRGYKMKMLKFQLYIANNIYNKLFYAYYANNKGNSVF